MRQERGAGALDAGAAGAHLDRTRHPGGPPHPQARPVPRHAWRLFARQSGRVRILFPFLQNALSLIVNLLQNSEGGPRQQQRRLQAHQAHASRQPGAELLLQRVHLPAV